MKQSRNQERLSTSRQVLCLIEAEAMRHPYEVALAPLGAHTLWCSRVDDLFGENSSQSKPFAVIVDLDCLPQPFEVEMERVRSHFPLSDLIALSSTDSSQLALQCLRLGFSDFLLKPASPEELAHCIRRAQQRRDYLKRLEDRNSSLIRAVTQISSCATPTLVRLYATEYLAQVMGAEGAAWVKLDSKGVAHSRVICSVPRGFDSSHVLFEIPFEKISTEKKRLLVLKSKKGTKRKVLIPCRDFPEAALFLWGVKAKLSAKILENASILLEHADISLLNLQKFDEVKQQTFIDDLTGLYNSRYLKYALTNAILRCKEPHQHFSVLFIDVDHFKAINDQHSHLVGSEFLVTIGKTIKNAVRRIDPVFRYGGDEFVVILNSTGVEGAMEIAERIRKNIERRLFVIQGKRIQTTVSIGLACYPIHATDRETLLKLADEAMYSAKRRTRNAVHLAVLPTKEATA